MIGKSIRLTIVAHYRRRPGMAFTITMEPQKGKTPGNDTSQVFQGSVLKSTTQAFSLVPGSRLLSVNGKGVEAVIKAWLVDVDIYDLLLGLTWMRRVHCNPHYGSGVATISGSDGVLRQVPAPLAPLNPSSISSS